MLPPWAPVANHPSEQTADEKCRDRLNDERPIARAQQRRDNGRDRAGQIRENVRRGKQIESHLAFQKRFMLRAEAENENAGRKSESYADESRLAVKPRQRRSHGCKRERHQKIQAQRKPKNGIDERSVELLAIDDGDVQSEISQHGRDHHDGEGHRDQTEIGRAQ